MTARLAAVLAALLAGACVQSAPPPASPPDAGAVEGSSCISAVNARIGSVSAVATGVEATATGAIVMLTDGSGPWRCVALADGTVTELTFEG